MERLKTPEKTMTSMLHSKFSDEKEYEEITDKIYDYATSLWRGISADFGLYVFKVICFPMHRLKSQIGCDVPVEFTDGKC